MSIKSSPWDRNPEAVDKGVPVEIEDGVFIEVGPVNSQSYVNRYQALSKPYRRQIDRADEFGRRKEQECQRAAMLGTVLKGIFTRVLSPESLTPNPDGSYVKRGCPDGAGGWIEDTKENLAELLEREVFLSRVLTAAQEEERFKAQRVEDAVGNSPSS